MSKKCAKVGITTQYGRTTSKLLATALLKAEELLPGFLLLVTAAGCSQHQAQRFGAACINAQPVNVGNSGIKFSSMTGTTLKLLHLPKP